MSEPKKPAYSEDSNELSATHKFIEDVHYAVDSAFSNDVCPEFISRVLKEFAAVLAGEQKLRSPKIWLKRLIIFGFLILFCGLFMALLFRPLPKPEIQWQEVP